jgi:hypothetical protein
MGLFVLPDGKGLKKRQVCKLARGKCARGCLKGLIKLMRLIKVDISIEERHKPVPFSDQNINLINFYKPSLTF